VKLSSRTSLCSHKAFKEKMALINSLALGHPKIQAARHSPSGPEADRAGKVFAMVYLMGWISIFVFALWFKVRTGSSYRLGVEDDDDDDDEQEDAGVNDSMSVDSDEYSHLHR
jgi:hypothetical protein